MHIRTAALAFALATTQAIAQQPPASPPRNAALDYWRAGAVAANARPAGKESAIASLSWDAVGANLDASKAPAAFEAARKEVSGDAVREYLRGAATPECDFQTHTEDGWKMLLPELAIVRDLSRMARVDARARLMEGDTRAAAERIVAMYRSAAHVSRENVMIASLVGMAIARAASDEARVLASTGTLGEADRRALLDAIKALRENDGFQIRGALEGERRATSGWILKEFGGEGGAARFVEQLVAMNEAKEEDKPITARVAAMSPKEFADAVRQMDGFYAQVIAAWKTGDPKRALSPVELGLVKGEFGPVARLLAPSLGKAVDAELRAHGELDAAAKALTTKP